MTCSREQLRDLVEGSGLGQDAVAEVLGIHQSTLWRWLAGERSIPPAYPRLLALETRQAWPDMGKPEKMTKP